MRSVPFFTCTLTKPSSSPSAMARSTVESGVAKVSTAMPWRAARADQYLVHRDLPRRELDHPPLPPARDTPELAGEDEANAFALEGPVQDLGGVRVLADENVRGGIEEDDLGAQAAERLRQLAADRAGADHGERGRALGQREDALVGQEAGLGEPRDGRVGRARAGRDHGALEAKRRAVDRDRVRPGEASVAQEDVNAELVLEALGRVVVADARPQPPHALHHGAEVRLGAVAQRYPEPGCVAHAAHE